MALGQNLVVAGAEACSVPPSTLYMRVPALKGGGCENQAFTPSETLRALTLDHHATPIAPSRPITDSPLTTQMAVVIPPSNSPGSDARWELARIAVTTAIITAPPTWTLVLTSPEARPCSSSWTPAVP